jgi:hypothetical protein
MKVAVEIKPLTERLSGRHYCGKDCRFFESFFSILPKCKLFNEKIQILSRSVSCYLRCVQCLNATIERESEGTNHQDKD